MRMYRFRRSKLAGLLPNLTARLCAFLCLCALAAGFSVLLRSQTATQSPSASDSEPQPAQTALSQPGTAQAPATQPAAHVDRQVPVDEPLPPPSAQDTQASDAAADDQPMADLDKSAESPSIPDGAQPAEAAGPVPASPSRENAAATSSSLVAAAPPLPKPVPADAGGDAARQQINNETANLLAMAYALKAEVDKTNSDTLSIVVVRKANEVEQLARKVLGEMKPAVLSKN